MKQQAEHSTHSDLFPRGIEWGPQELSERIEVQGGQKCCYENHFPGGALSGRAPAGPGACVESTVEGSKEVAAAKQEPAAENDWKVPRTAWGDSDFQGIWTVIGDYFDTLPTTSRIWYENATDRSGVRKEEMAEANQDNEAVGHIYFDTLNGKPSRRTSLIIDPPTGGCLRLLPKGNGDLTP